MVTYRDVAKRHAVYVTSTLAVILLSQYTWTLASVLTCLLAGIKWHQNTPIGFAVLTFFATPIASSLCVKLSSHTWWYAHQIDLISIPPWLFPLHGLLAHWVLDAYFLVTLSEVRKITLP